MAKFVYGRIFFMKATEIKLVFIRSIDIVRSHYKVVRGGGVNASVHLLGF